MSTIMQNHLRKYVEDGIQQKIRLGNLIQSYEEQEVKSRERVIDQLALENDYKNKGISPDKVVLVKQRREMDNEIFEKSKERVQALREEMHNMTLRLNTHLEELSAIEIDTGGFVTHAIGINKKAKLNKETMTVTMDYTGSIEIPIAARLSKWKDSSQITIKKLKKVGV